MKRVSTFFLAFKEYACISGNSLTFWDLKVIAGNFYKQWNIISRYLLTSHFPVIQLFNQ